MKFNLAEQRWKYCDAIAKNVLGPLAITAVVNKLPGDPPCPIIRNGRWQTF